LEEDIQGLPRMKLAANDRAPTFEEIRKLVEYPNRRIKPIVYTMCASGIRLGAWDYLRWKHVSPITNDKEGELVAAKLLIYAVGLLIISSRIYHPVTGIKYNKTTHYSIIILNGSI
jgi:hypothetical protein